MATKLESAAQEALKVISNAAQEATKTIAAAAAEAAKLTNDKDNKDHDLLQRLDEKVDSIILQIKDMNDGTTGKIKDLEADKADRKELEAIQVKLNTDIENRMRALEAAKGLYLTSMVIYTAVGVTMIGLIIWHLFQN